ncbi:hypothetical protein [Salininema proteolyticum]|uniref:S1 motif domain-containing protein n=1 Tax=Salininema proteolyticum TaxID=1607685 RepID=A0ABV8TTS8_9ACTN
MSNCIEGLLPFNEFSTELVEGRQVRVRVAGVDLTGRKVRLVSEPGRSGSNDV